MDLASIASTADQKARADQYRQALEQLVATPSSEQLQQFVDHMLDSEVPIVISRPLLLELVASLPKLPADVQQQTARALEQMASREVSFEEPRTQLRKFIAQSQEDDEDWGAAAETLAQVDVERVTPAMSAEAKVSHFVKITMLYLEDDNAVDAERFFVKASNLVGQIEDSDLLVRYQACYARIADSKRRFLGAAMKYYELSQDSTGKAAEQDIRAALQSAVTCAILAPAGAHRSRMLSMLYKDERVTDAQAVPQFPFMEKMLMERLIAPEDVKQFSELLKEHQKATLADGFSVLESAVIQHNLRSVSNMYRNIAVDQLALLLGLSEEKVESLACDMIFQGRLKGHIDQVDGVIFFEGEQGPLADWDEHIRSTCEAVDTVIQVLGQGKDVGAVS